VKTVKAAHVGDRVLLTVELPEGSVVPGVGVAEVTLDSEKWREIAKRVGRAADAADRESDPNHVATRVKTTLDQVVNDALRQQIDPVLARRRAVAGLLHRLGDLVGTGSLRGFDVVWHSAVDVRVTAETHGRAVVLRYDLTEVGP
jgi:hypothetical protein